MADTPKPETPKSLEEMGIKKSLQALGVTDFKGMQTVKNEETGTIYGVIAEAKGLTLSISPRIDVRINTPFVGIFVRVRAQKKEDWANLDDAGSTFGISELQTKSDQHASVEFFMFVSAHPCTPYDAGQIIVKNSLFEVLLGTVLARVDAAGVKLLVDKQVIFDYVMQEVADSLPSEPVKPFTEFPVLVGGEQIHKQMIKLAEEYGFLKKKPKPKPSAPEGNDAAED